MSCCCDKAVAADLQNKLMDDVAAAFKRNYAMLTLAGGCPADGVQMAFKGLTVALAATTGPVQAFNKRFDQGLLDDVLNTVRAVACIQHGFDHRQPFNPSTAPRQPGGDTDTETPGLLLAVALILAKPLGDANRVHFAKRCLDQAEKLCPGLVEPAHYALIDPTPQVQP